MWEDNSVEDRILHGQWSTPSVGEIGGVMQVVHAQGDGWVRGYEALTGKKLWEFDTNPKDSVWPKTRNEVISTPVIFENVVYIANGQDPEHGEGVGHAYAIDAHQARRHHADRAALALRQDPPLDFDGGDQGRPDLPGRLQRLPALPRSEDRQALWMHDMFAAIWGSPMIIDDKVYLGDEDGDVTVLQHGKELKVDRRSRTWAARSTRPSVPANGTLFVMNRNQLYALAEGASAQASHSAGGSRYRMRRRDFLAVARRRSAWPPARVAARAGSRRAAPADAWPQFRGTPSLTGVSATTIPPQLEASLDLGRRRVPVDSRRPSSTASSTSAPPPASWSRIGLADGKLRWRYKAGESIGESSPAVAGGRVFIGDLDGVVHAVNAADGKAAWTYKTRSEIKSSPIVVGDLVLIGSYDGALYALGAADGKQRWIGQDRQLRARHAVRSSTASRTSPAATRSSTRCRVATAARSSQASATAYTGASVGDRRRRRLLRHVRQSGRSRSIWSRRAR